VTCTRLLVVASLLGFSAERPALFRVRQVTVIACMPALPTLDSSQLIKAKLLSRTDL
jgi:hypothetical protein